MRRPTSTDEREPIGVVLAGGQSRRFGRDKAIVEVEGSSLARRAAERLTAVYSNVVVADAGRGLLEDFESIEDGSGRGPASGILGAAGRFPGRSLLVLACDLPAVPVRLLRVIGMPTTNKSDPDLVMAKTSRGVEPLCALYGPNALERLAERVADGDFSLHPLATDPDLAARCVEADDELLLNINRPQDLDSLNLDSLNPEE